MLKVVICDDEEFYLDGVSRLVERYASDRPELRLSVFAYKSPFALMDDVDRGSVGDVYLLDIYMDATNGIELARSLREAIPACQIIFLTTSREHAIAAFEVGAAHYLEKPIDAARFAQAMDRAVAALAGKPVEMLVCQTADGTVERVPFSSVILVEASQREQRLELADGRRVTVHETLASIFEKLSVNDGFISPYRSFVINMKYVVKITSSHITMTNGSQVPLARNEFMKVKRKFMEYTLTDKGSERR